jgi:hypothetical protein
MAPTPTCAATRTPADAQGTGGRLPNPRFAAPCPARCLSYPHGSHHCSRLMWPVLLLSSSTVKSLGGRLPAGVQGCSGHLVLSRQPPSLWRLVLPQPPPRLPASQTTMRSQARANLLFFLSWKISVISGWTETEPNYPKPKLLGSMFHNCRVPAKQGTPFSPQKLPTKAELRPTAHHSRPRPYSAQNQSQRTSARAPQRSSASSNPSSSRPTLMTSSVTPIYRPNGMHTLMCAQRSITHKFTNYNRSIITNVITSRIFKHIVLTQT